MLVADTSFHNSTSSAVITNYRTYAYDVEGTASCKKWYQTYDCDTTITYDCDATTTWKKVVKVIEGTSTETTETIWVWDSCDYIHTIRTDSCDYIHTIRTPKDRLKEIIQQRQAPAFIRSRKHLQAPIDIREIRARETLQRVLGDQKFRSFLKNGFVSVRAKSGLVYQIFPGHDITKVYRDGQMAERLCVVLKGLFPPTDSLIMRYLLILNDEQDFRKHAISHSVHNFNRKEVKIDERPLTEIYNEIKVA